jgi:hypothetical protein
MSVAWFVELKREPSVAPTKGSVDGPSTPYPRICASLEEAITVLFSASWTTLRQPPRSPRRTLPIPQAAYYGFGGPDACALAAAQGRGVLPLVLARGEQVLLSHHFPGIVGLHPSSFNRRVRKLRRFVEPPRWEVLPEPVGQSETSIVDSTLLEALHARRVGQDLEALRELRG